MSERGALSSSLTSACHKGVIVRERITPGNSWQFVFWNSTSSSRRGLHPSICFVKVWCGKSRQDFHHLSLWGTEKHHGLRLKSPKWLMSWLNCPAHKDALSLDNLTMWLLETVTKLFVRRQDTCYKWEMKSSEKLDEPRDSAFFPGVLTAVWNHLRGSWQSSQKVNLREKLLNFPGALAQLKKLTADYLKGFQRCVWKSSGSDKCSIQTTGKDKVWARNALA